jgi:hypothetical protein
MDRLTPFIGYCDIRLAAIASAPGRTRRTRLQDGALCQPWGPQFQAWSWSRCGELGPSLTQSRRFVCLEVVMFGSAQEESNIRCRRRPPLQMDDDDDHYAPAPAPPQAQQRRRCPPQSMDESGQGPRTAVAVAVASPLGVQPNINSAGISSSTGQPLGTMQLEKATPSARCYGRVSP